MCVSSLFPMSSLSSFPLSSLFLLSFLPFFPSSPHHSPVALPSSPHHSPVALPPSPVALPASPHHSSVALPLSPHHSPVALHCKVIVSEHQLSGRIAVYLTVLSVATLVHGSKKIVHCCIEVSHTAMHCTPGREGGRDYSFSYSCSHSDCTGFHKLEPHVGESA